MKKYLLLLSLLLVILLTSCGSADMHDPDETNEPKTVYSFNIDTLSFIDDDTYDILNGYSNNHTDFMYALNTISNDNITETEIAAFEHLLTVFDELSIKGKKSYSQILTYSNKDLQDMCEAYNVTLEPIDIFTFNLLKSYQENKTDYKFYNVTMLKNDYIEMRLNREISIEESTALDELQKLHTSYYSTTYSTFTLKTFTFDTLMKEYTDNISYNPTEEELAQLEIAFNILIELDSLNSH